ncbi:hypothetical protein GW819_04120 [Candidatus Gracilibacteria bacterium]|nr:hypothetical protein [Candidatus Gracilibacteria bacterium]OIO75860.1 MAG: hypothetical protein AUJ87_03960 [Candidatus Gracilibacteria bacterium CG1_02_38_174]
MKAEIEIIPYGSDFCEVYIRDGLSMGCEHLSGDIREIGRYVLQRMKALRIPDTVPILVRGRDTTTTMEAYLNEALFQE